MRHSPSVLPSEHQRFASDSELKTLGPWLMTQLVLTGDVLFLDILETFAMGAQFLWKN